MLYKGNQPEWTAENMNREEGSTNFEICGWCEYTGGGTCRYGCNLSSTCSLLKSYDRYNKEHDWNTPCVIRQLGQHDIKNLVRYHQGDIKSMTNRIETVKGFISALIKISDEVKSSPPLPDSRGADYHPIGMVCFVYHEGKWCRGTTAYGYRTHDGCVSYVLDDYPESKGKPDGSGPWGCGMSVPGILLDWEFQYFRKHLGEFEQWLSLCDKKLNQYVPDYSAYLEALRDFSES